MENDYVVSYAASFGDANFDEQTYETLKKRLSILPHSANRAAW